MELSNSFTAALKDSPRNELDLLAENPTTRHAGLAHHLEKGSSSI